MIQHFVFYGLVNYDRISEDPTSGTEEKGPANLTVSPKRKDNILRP